MRKLTAVFGILLLAVASSNLAAKDRRGADAVIVKKDAGTVRGELIAVNDHSILVKDSITQTDLSFEISDVVSLSVKVAKKRSPWPSAAIGLVALGGLGAFVGHELGNSEGSLLDVQAGFTIVGAAVGGIVGGGGYLMAKKKRQEVYGFPGKSPEEMRAILLKLRTYARVPDYR